jgi:hypothetical protein
VDGESKLNCTFMQCNIRMQTNPANVEYSPLRVIVNVKMKYHVV